jgi:DNA-binding transcriptional LysR family regulator
MDRLDAMATVVAAAEAGSLSAAARRLKTPLATVSRKVSELEAHLGARLFIRSARRLTLTDAGQDYLAASRRILEEVGEAERAASGEYRAPRGDLVITAPVVFGRLHVLPIVTGFLQAYPEINVRLALADRVVDLAEDRVDVAVRIGPLPDSGLIATRLGAQRRLICASPAYFAAHGEPATPDDLSKHDCVTSEGLISPAVWIFAAGKSEVAIPLRSRLIVTTAEAAVDAAIAGVGLTRVFAYQAAEAVRIDALRVALSAFEPAPWPVNLVHAERSLTPIKLRAFLDFATPRLKQRLGRIVI